MQDFVAEVIQLYFEDSVGKIDKMGQIASSTSGAPDFNELDQLVHQVGAARGRGAGRKGAGRGGAPGGGGPRERGGAGESHGGRGAGRGGAVNLCLDGARQSGS